MRTKILLKLHIEKLSELDITIPNESVEYRDETSKESLLFPVSETYELEEENLRSKLKVFKVFLKQYFVRTIIGLTVRNL